MHGPAKSPSLASDVELIRDGRADPAAFEELFNRHAVTLRRWILAQVGDNAAAQDLLAETFAAAWVGSRAFRGHDDRAAVGWLYGIAKNLLRQYYRRGRVETAARDRLRMTSNISDDGGIDDVPSHMDVAELAPAVRQAFAMLTHEQQAAIGYRVVEQLNYDEAALRLGCSPITVRTRVFRGLELMRNALMKDADNNAEGASL